MLKSDHFRCLWLHWVKMEESYGFCIFALSHHKTTIKRPLCWLWVSVFILEVVFTFSLLVLTLNISLRHDCCDITAGNQCVPLQKLQYTRILQQTDWEWRQIIFLFIYIRDNLITLSDNFFWSFHATLQLKPWSHVGAHWNVSKYKLLFSHNVFAFAIYTAYVIFRRQSWKGTTTEGLWCASFFWQSELIWLLLHFPTYCVSSSTLTFIMSLTEVILNQYGHEAFKDTSNSESFYEYGCAIFFYFFILLQFNTRRIQSEIVWAQRD